MTDLAFVPSTRNIDLYAGDGAIIVLNITTQKGAAIPILGPVAAHIRAHRLDPNPVDQFKVELDRRARRDHPPQPQRHPDHRAAQRRRTLHRQLGLPVDARRL